MTRLNGGHLLLALLALLAAWLGLRAMNIIAVSAEPARRFAMPAMTDMALLSRQDPFFATSPAAEDLAVTALPFTLHGLRRDIATAGGAAIIAASDGVQKVYAVGDSLGDGVTLSGVAGDHVILNNGGRQEALWLDNSGVGKVSRYDPDAAGDISTPPNPEVMPPSDTPEPPPPRPSDSDAASPSDPPDMPPQ